MLTGKNYVGYELSAENTSVFESINPETEEKNEKFHIATQQEVNQAVKKAQISFLEYSAKTVEERAGFLVAIGHEILELGDELIITYCRETGLPEARAKGEMGRTIGQLNEFASYIKNETQRFVF